ncbi:hypothetical protein WD019_16255 [Fictibacillus sp. Mic-4]|uniref:hypothetical protein n=1 Tax=Fictibacillus TaxID=1329200 RepID=UPI00041B7B2C|nr:hypothetical protein [Fictibacillus gelatini]
MKKLFGIAASLLLAFSIVGCSNKDTAEKNDNEPKKVAKTDNAVKEKTEVLNFEGDLSNKLRTWHAPYNAYIAAQDPEKKTPKKDLEKAKTDAKASLEKAVSEIPNITVPATLPKDDQDNIKAALEDLKKSYEARAASLNDEKKGAEADKLFKSFNDKLNKVHEKLKLVPADLSKEIS